MILTVRVITEEIVTEMMVQITPRIVMITTAPNMGDFRDPPGINDASPYGSSDSYQSGYDADNYYNYPASYPGHSGKTHKYPHQRRMPQGSSTIPIKAILIVVAIITGIVLCVVFRDEITQFIAQLLAWIIVICIAVIVLRLLFRRRR